jgi:DNA mismatch repair ATPase MutS
LFLHEESTSQFVEPAHCVQTPFPYRFPVNILFWIEHAVQAWDGLATAASTLDVLVAFALFLNDSEGPTCMPSFAILDSAAGGDAAPVFDVEAMWHPGLALVNRTVPVLNDLLLGTSQGTDSTTSGTALLLTGPNMVRPLLQLQDPLPAE